MKKLIFIPIGLLAILMIGIAFIPSDSIPLLQLQKPSYSIDMNVSCVAFSPDGKRMVVGDRSSWKILDTQTQEILHQHSQKEGCFTHIAISPDGKQVAILEGVENEIYIWDIRRKSLVFHQEFYTDWITALKFSPDGQKLLLTSSDSTTSPGFYIWDI